MESLLGECLNTSTGPANSLFVLLLQSLISSHCLISSPDQWPVDYAPAAIKNGLQSYDFIIVGGGTTGSVLANRLSENKNWQILLLEAGGDPPTESQIPLMFLNLQNTTSTWNYFAETNEFASKSFAKGSYLPCGKTLGGSGSINSMAYVRGNPKDYDRWGELGNDGWNWETVLRYFKKSEDMQIGSFLNMNRGKYHSAGGPLKISSFYSVEPLKNIILEAALERKHKEIIDINAAEHVGFSIAGGTLYEGERFGPATAFLSSIKDRTNLHVIKNAFVTKILFDNQHAIGVEFDIKTPGGTQHLSAKTSKEVLVSAGTLNTPKLLQLSGVGPKDLLERHNISLISNLSVGENLKDHIAVPLFYKYHVSKSEPFSAENFANEIYMYSLHRVGPFASVGVADLVGFINTKNQSSLYPNIQYNFLNFQRGMPGLESLLTRLGYCKSVISNLVKANKDAPLFQVLVTLLHPTDTGTVHLRSDAPYDAPRITTNFLKSPMDVEVLIEGIKEFKSFEKTNMFKAHEIEYVPLELNECNNELSFSETYWECYVRQTSVSGHDQVGTVKMGPDSDKGSVLDSQFRVKGIRNLRVVDSSVMPTTISAGNYATAIMIGERGADFVKDDWKD